MYVNILKLNQPGFPKLLSEIHSPPKQIYWAGLNPNDWLSKPRVAIVGSRKATQYGRSVTAKLAEELAGAGVVTISGLAYGIDIAAHQAALTAGGLTVAVLGTGLDEIYPSAHVHVAKQIMLQGSLLTEYPVGATGFPSNFIARNRIVSGLADILLITEAAVNSGSLHTARFALEQGKTVMAVPGNINSLTSEGCNNLIKSGALPVTDVSDIFFALGLSRTTDKTRYFNGTPQERKILDLIKEGITSQEELAPAARLDTPVLANTLTMLELSGHIRPAGGGNWLIV